LNRHIARRHIVKRTLSHPTLLLSGIAGGSWSLLPLRSFLRSEGIDARICPKPFVLAYSVGHYGRGLAYDLGQRHEPITLVGWSMGGYIAVEAMADPAAAAMTSRIITFGTPHEGTAVALIPHWLGLRINVSDFAPGSRMIARHRRLIDDPARTWDFFAINGKYDPVAPGPLKSLPAESALTGPYSHISLIGDSALFRQVAELILR
jgi:pimeloyl-ACP methyl ester carboxylesterase